jgi:50S ribosomal protein L16 3-hydroxylase
LLVQDVEKHVGGFERVLQPLRFLPDWRIDDVMISYATEGGSVGPHHDSYDVFLVQALGRRRWQWNPRFDPRLRSDCDLRVLAGFEPAEQAVVEPGDVLYLPPGVAHFGVALEPCLTLSIGFRAPDQRQLALAFADELTDRAHGERRFCDPDRAPCPSPLELAATDRAELRRLLREALDQSDQDLDAFLGRYLTQPKPHFEPTGDEPVEDAAALARRLTSGGKLRRRLGSRWLVSVAGEELSLFTDGQCLAARPEDRPWIESLARGESADEDLLSEAPGRGRLLVELLRLGSLTWEEDDDGDDGAV